MNQDTFKFLKLLTGVGDPVATFVPLRKGVPGRPFLNRRYAEVEATLQALNRTGNDIYFTVNATDGIGRRAENIKYALACWADYDQGVPDTWKLGPTLRVQSSPGKEQCYWLMFEYGLPADARWAAANKGLAVATRADTNACDAARILRLPGYVNHKYADKPTVCVTHWGDYHYSLAEIEKAWEPVHTVLSVDEASERAAAEMDNGEKLRRYAAWLRRVGAVPAAGTGLRSWLFKKAAAGVIDFALPATIVAESLIQLPDLDGDVDMDRLLRIALDADRYGKKARGSALLERRPGGTNFE